MNSVDEAVFRRNWELLKQEIDVDDFVRKLVKAGVWGSTQAEAVLNAAPANRDAKAERFLHAVVNSGTKCLQTMCNILLENRDNPRYETLVKALGIQQSFTQDSGVSTLGAVRQSTTMSAMSSTSSLNLNVGACAENLSGERSDRMVSARAPWRADEFFRREDTEENRPSTPAEAVQAAVQKASDEKSGNLDMDALEQELVKIAPTIADLFSKIHTQTTTVVATSDEELKKIREDNDRLRKTNRSLVEKLNSFQQKIIQLQLENKKLREFNDNEKIKQTQLDERSLELDLLKEKLIFQKHALEAKEKELDLQLEKLQSVVTDNEEQKLKLANLEQLHEEGLTDFEEQQIQIDELKKEKEQQKEQIEVLEVKQKMNEQFLVRLEERLAMLEQRGNQKKTRTRFMGTKPWMNGMMGRSHHVHVKIQPQFPTDFSSANIGVKGGKGWSF
ncbi:restin homolog [Mya arenaria]|uniref:restin homolog n=1 Tax=Mya arenaria TaxID=6604 RepID=UPI0022DEFC7D|nr:restin homolog [Mya arenaria]